MDTIHERSSGLRRSIDDCTPAEWDAASHATYEKMRLWSRFDSDRRHQLPTAEDIRALLAKKQYFDNDYSPSDFLHCACRRADCPRCFSPHDPQDRKVQSSGL